MAFLAKSRVLAKYVGASVLDTLFPPRCYACGVMTSEAGNLCSKCWGEIDFISDLLCTRCGTPFPHSMGGDQAECMPCMEKPPAYAKARSVFLYTDESRSLVTGYKYHDRTQATPMFVRWLMRSAAPVLEEAQIIVPVPLHATRLLERRYNQSALLARALSKETHIPACVDGLQRTRATPAQAGLNREERQKNVQDAFCINPKREAEIKGRTVLLIDDVMTTGATLNACADALLDGGAEAVHVLTLARTLPGEV